LEKKSSNSVNEKSCPTCCRPFSSEEETVEVVEFLKAEIGKIPSKVKTIESRLKESLSKLDKLQQFFPEKMACQDIQQGLDDKQKRVSDGKKSTSNTKKQLETFEVS
jgi:hypothetical protein